MNPTKAHHSYYKPTADIPNFNGATIKEEYTDSTSAWEQNNNKAIDEEMNQIFLLSLQQLVYSKCKILNTSTSYSINSTKPPNPSQPPNPIHPFLSLDPIQKSEVAQKKWFELLTLLKKHSKYKKRILKKKIKLKEKLRLRLKLKFFIKKRTANAVRLCKIRLLLYSTRRPPSL